MESLEHKIVMLGSQGVGKTSIILQYVQGQFFASVPTTIGAAFFTHKLIVGGVRCRLQLWDTAGQERFRSMAPMYYRNAHAAILVYDVTSLASLEALAAWASEVRAANGPSLVLAVLANKADVPAKSRVVSAAQGEAFALSIGALFAETTATDQASVSSAFLRVTEALLRAGAGTPRTGTVAVEGAGGGGKCC